MQKPDSDKQAADRGIELTREWIATKDARTRHSHGAADGQRVGVDEPFTVGGEKLMFPGDASMGASGRNLYNCRCTIKAMVKGHERARETYDQWLEKKMAADPEGTTLEFKKAARRSADYAQWQEYREIVGNNVQKTFDKFQNFKYTETEKWEYVKGLKKYLTKYQESSQTFYDIQQTLKVAGIDCGVSLPPVRERAYILPSGKNDAYHIMQRMMERNITDDEVRSYAENAKIMFEQWCGKRRRYISESGMVVMHRTDNGWIYKTAWKASDYDEEADKIMEVIKNAGL